MDLSSLKRQPTSWLNYRGDVRKIDRSTPLGPNLFGEHLWPVVAFYDESTDMTRVGLSLIAPEVTR